MRTAIITLTENGRKISKRISDNLSGVSRYAFEKHCEEEIPFSGLSALTDDIFKKFDALIYICAVGCAVRVIAPNISSKFTDPAVIAVDDRGKYAVSLLSGHIGGANALAEKIAGMIGALPVITTATDAAGSFSPDMFAVKNNLFINEKSLAKEIAAAFANGENTAFYSDFFCENVPDIFSENSEVGICVSFCENKNPFKKTLHLIPKNIAVGLGCKKNTDSEKMSEFVYGILSRNNISVKRIREVNSVDLKKDENCILNIAERLNAPTRFFSARELTDVQGTFSHSDFVMKTVGADNVCERSACATGGKLIIPKITKNGMSFAAAELPVKVVF